MKVHIPVLLGAVRFGRQSEKVARYIIERMGSMDSVTTQLLDLSTYQFPIMLERMDHTEEPTAELLAFSEQLQEADGLIIVSPEYKGGYPGVLKNAFDYMDAGILKYTPVGICTVSSGDFGGVNCLAQLRLVCLALGGTPIPGKVAVSRVKDQFDDHGNCVEPKLRQHVEAFLSELLWYTKAFVGHRHTERTQAR